ncbi:MFS transporter [Bifidobacterium psychraerophilum]|uniref:MFS transporter n=1 Tax=Bifidobacterium psychraerophilum TaxID=218140 RepID=UPI0039EC4940
MVLLISAVFMYVMTFMLTPTLPLYVDEISVGTVVATGGLIVAAYTFGSLLSRLIWGRLTDIWGRRPVYLIGAFIMLLISPCFGSARILAVIVVLRLVQGVGFSASSTAAATMAADLVPASRRGEGIGYYALANTVGMAIGPELGMYILQHLGYRWLFASSAFLGMLALMSGAFVTTAGIIRVRSVVVRKSGFTQAARKCGDRIKNIERRTATMMSSHERRRLIEPKALPSSIVLLFVIMPYGAVMAYIGAYGLHQGVNDIGIFFSVFAAALFIVRLFTGRISDRYGVQTVIVPAAVLMGVGLFILLWASSLVVFLLSATLFGSGFGIAMPVLQATAYTLSADDRRGAAGATVFASADIAYGLGALLLGLGISAFGYPIAFAALSVLDVVVVVLFITVLRPRLIETRLT